ncbi:MAG TPA: V-type ATP synthase subunit E, partial [Parachlamydiaceae bacterium]|nr:V-type ATP synthase subunit E [Parachlamydiaceae bacterium]
LLLSHILRKLKDQTVQVGPIAGGIQIKLIDKKMTLDMTKESVEDFLKVYLRKDFREKLFRTKDS